MSRLQQPRVYAKPGSSTGVGGGDKTVSSMKKTPASAKGAKAGEAKTTEFEIQPLSLPPKKHVAINWEDIKKKTIRRNAPEGEDKKELVRVLKSLKEQPQNVSVQEFINLVSPFTGDNGATFRSIMEEDLTSFRKLTKKIYDTMTQDVSDVLVNEQMQMTAFYQNRTEMLQEKLNKMINEIYVMAPEFKFEEFFRDREMYLNTILPIPRAVQRKSEDIEMQRRQEAFHRVQWLKIEGERLAEENRRLQNRLNQLKQQQLDEQAAAAEAVVQAEATKQQLQAQEAQKIEVLDALNESIGKTMVRTEAFINTQTNAEARQAGAEAAKAALLEQGPGPSTGAIKKRPGDKGKKKKKARPEWVSATAEEIEKTALDDRMNTEFAGADDRRTQRRGRRSPHFSPVKTPPPKPPRERSPFHYSPPKFDEPLRELPPVIQSTSVEHTTTSVQEPRAGPSRMRKNMTPRDAWGGF